MNRTSFLFIGAGPYSIAAAAYAKYLGVDVIIVGKPLDFWKTNMPRGMFCVRVPIGSSTRVK